MWIMVVLGGGKHEFRTFMECSTSSLRFITCTNGKDCKAFGTAFASVRIKLDNISGI